MIEFRDRYTRRDRRQADRPHQSAKPSPTARIRSGSARQRCCGLLKTKALLDGLRAGGFDAAIGGARRDEEKSRAKERIFSFRDDKGQWDPKNQRPELWNLYNGRIDPGESMRVFPLSNWTEMDVWQYIHVENIPIVPMYFAKDREMLVRGESLDPAGAAVHSAAARREAADGALPHAVARLQPLHRRHPVRRRHGAEDHRGAGFVPALRAREPRDRSRSGRLHGDQEARGILLMMAALDRPHPLLRDRRVPGRKSSAKDLLRFTTAGSVDDGKSTLIGRLLYDSQSVYEDQTESGHQGLGQPLGRAHRFFAAHRRPARRARAGHHHRRRLPLFRHRAAQVHHRRHAGPRAVHAQHGHRRIHRRPGHHPDRRAQRRLAAVAPPRLHRFAARHSELRRRREQDGLWSATTKTFFARIENRVSRVSGPHLRTPRRMRISCPSARWTAITWCGRSRNMPWFDGPSLLEYLETVPVHHRTARSRVSFSGAARDPARSEFPRLCRTGGFRASFGPATAFWRCPPDDARASRASRHSTAAWRSHRAHVGHADARRRARHQPRRHARLRAQDLPRSRASSMRAWCG